jgi:pyrophosphatase PpaX
MSSDPDWTAILFDLDGTVADTVNMILACYRHTMEAHLEEVPPDERWLSGMGTPLVTQLRGFARSQEESEAMLETYQTYQRSIHESMVTPFPGIPEVLGNLTERGIPLAIVTSKRQEMTSWTLSACGLGDRFPTVVTASDITKGKPDPEPVLLALEWLGIAPSPRVLFVGDSIHDVGAGQAAGIRTAAVTWGPFGADELQAVNPDFMVGEPGELLALKP